MYSKENLTKIEKMNSLVPEVMKAFWAFDKKPGLYDMTDVLGLH